jgi:hypothetical protein
MNPLSRTPDRVQVDSTLRRWAYVPVMGVIVVGVVAFAWPWLAWRDRRLRRDCGLAWGAAGQSRVVIGYEPGTPWHEAIIAHWIPRYGDRTSLVDLAKLGSAPASLEDRVYRRWKPAFPGPVRLPVIIVVPARGRVSTVSFAGTLSDRQALERRFTEVARVAGFDASASSPVHGDDPLRRR